MYAYNSPEDMYNWFDYTFSTIIETNAPLKLIKIYPNKKKSRHISSATPLVKPWADDEVKNMSQMKKDFFSKLRIEQNTYEFFDLQKMQKQTQQPRQKEET